MTLIKITLIQILVLILISFGALVDGEMFWSCFAGLYAIPYVLILIHFAPYFLRGANDINLPR